MYENSGSQFFRTTSGTTEIQSEQDAFDKPRVFKSFITILGITELL